MTRRMGTLSKTLRGQCELGAAFGLVSSEDSVKGEKLAAICHPKRSECHGYRYVTLWKRDEKGTC
jgi:hypothetical protein